MRDGKNVCEPFLTGYHLSTFADQSPFFLILSPLRYQVSTKITVVEALINKVDKLIIGGGMVFTFLKAQGHGVSPSFLLSSLLSPFDIF